MSQRTSFKVYKPLFMPIATYERWVRPLLRFVLRQATQGAGDRPHLRPLPESRAAFDTSHARTDLRGSGVEIPDVRQHFLTLLRYCVDSDWGRRPVGKPGSQGAEPRSFLRERCVFDKKVVPDHRSRRGLPRCRACLCRTGALLALTDTHRERLCSCAVSLGSPERPCPPGGSQPPDQATAFAHATEQALSRIDIVVHIAGGFRMGDVHETSESD